MVQNNDIKSVNNNLIILEIIKHIIVEYVDNINPDGITMSSDMSKDLDIDSLDKVQLLMNFEDKFGIEIPDDDAYKIHTVGDAVNYIVAKEKK